MYLLSGGLGFTPKTFLNDSLNDHSKLVLKIGREGWHLKIEFEYTNSVLAKGD